MMSRNARIDWVERIKWACALSSVSGTLGDGVLRLFWSSWVAERDDGGYGGYEEAILQKGQDGEELGDGGIVGRIMLLCGVVRT